MRLHGTFAATEDDFENDRGCKDMLKVVKYKELYDNLGDEGRSTLHKYAREKSESLRVSLKRAREARPVWSAGGATQLTFFDSSKDT